MRHQRGMIDEVCWGNIETINIFKKGIVSLSTTRQVQSSATLLPTAVAFYGLFNLIIKLCFDNHTPYPLS